METELANRYAKAVDEYGLNEIIGPAEGNYKHVLEQGLHNKIEEVYRRFGHILKIADFIDKGDRLETVYTAGRGLIDKVRTRKGLLYNIADRFDDGNGLLAKVAKWYTDRRDNKIDAIHTGRENAFKKTERIEDTIKTIFGVYAGITLKDFGLVAKIIGLNLIDKIPIVGRFIEQYITDPMDLIVKNVDNAILKYAVNEFRDEVNAGVYQARIPHKFGEHQPGDNPKLRYGLELEKVAGVPGYRAGTHDGVNPKRIDFRDFGDNVIDVPYREVRQDTKPLLLPETVGPANYNALPMNV